MQSRYIVPTFKFYYSRSYTPHRKKTNSSVSLSQIGESLFSAAIFYLRILFTPLSHLGLYPHVSVCHPRACLTAIRVVLQKLSPQMRHFEILVEHRLTHVCHGTVRSSEILLEEDDVMGSIHGPLSSSWKLWSHSGVWNSIMPAGIYICTPSWVSAFQKKTVVVRRGVDPSIIITGG